MDELTEPEAALVVASATAPGAGPGERTGPSAARSAATVTGLNLLSRATGFARVLATAGALGIAALGDAYQRANLVSNILFELLAGGLLFSVLVPTFVAGLRRGEREHVRALAGVLLGRALVGLSVVVVLGIAAGPILMRLLTAAGADGELRDQQVELGSFLLWFVMPQLLLYGAAAVSTALLQADRRFVAASLNPVCNNVIVIATMVAFAIVHDSDAGLALTTGEKVLLGAGTLAGTVGLAVLPLAATWRAGLGVRPRWSAPGVTGLGALARKGAWGAGDVGLNQALVAATVVFAGRVSGGVIAYQTAFTFFLLPHAVLAHPIYTVRFPELSAYGTEGNYDAFAAEVAAALRSMALLLVPAAALMAAMAAPLLTLIRIGRVDAQGSQLVAAVLAAYLTGLLGYSAFFLLTRASYAIDDVRAPTTVFLGVTVLAVVGMAVASAMVDGDAQVVVLGLANGLAVSLGSIRLHRRLRRRVGRPMPVLATLVRIGVASLVAALLAWGVVTAIGWDRRRDALLALVVGGTVGLVAYALVLLGLREPELLGLRARFGRRG